MARLLAVDDRPEMLFGLKQALEVEHSVLLAPDGECGLALYELHRPDVVLFDLLMPRMGGIELADRIRSRDPDARLIALTCMDETREAAGLLNKGVLEYLVKPVEPEEVNAAVRRALTRHGRGCASHVETPTTREAEARIGEAAGEGVPLILYGGDGSGRRTALRRAAPQLSTQSLICVDADTGSATSVLRDVLDRFDDTVGVVCLRFRPRAPRSQLALEGMRRDVLRVFSLLRDLRSDQGAAPPFVVGLCDVEGDPRPRARATRDDADGRIVEVYVKRPSERPEELASLVRHFGAANGGPRRAGDATWLRALRRAMSSAPELDSVRFVRAASLRPELVFEEEAATAV